MTDVTNPGLTNVADESVGNPDPNGGTALSVPEEDDRLVQAANQGYPPADNGVISDVHPTPAEIVVGEPVPLPPSPPSANLATVPEVDVADQVIGQGSWLPDPANPLFKIFVTPSDFIVTGPADSFQTNTTSATLVNLTVTGVFDADTLGAPSATTSRYLLTVGPPALTSYPVSLLGRQVTFADDTLTPGDQGANRNITGYGTNYLVVDRDDPTVDAGSVPSLDQPQVGDTLVVDVNRQGSEQVNTTGLPPAEVYVLPPPPAFVANPPQADLGGGTTDVSTGPQPGTPFVGSGTRVPAAVDVFVADQPTSVGLPANVFP